MLGCAQSFVCRCPTTLKQLHNPQSKTKIPCPVIYAKKRVSQKLFLHNEGPAHTGTWHMFLYYSSWSPYGRILQPIHFNGLKLHQYAEKVVHVLNFRKCVAPNHMVLQYPAIWCPQMHCICDLHLGCRKCYTGIGSRLQRQCILRAVQETHT